MTLWDLVLTKGMGDPFTKLSLERIEKQKEQFAKPIISSIPSIGLFLIPLAIIAFLVLKK
tara:strand:- start:19 stop:198 length:180 start_codon:yes stop_codon:yes gene_type:complete